MLPAKIFRLRREKLSVVQRHILGCLLVWWITLPLSLLLPWMWTVTHNLYLGIFTFVVIFTFVGISLHLGLNPMRKVLANLANRE